MLIRILDFPVPVYYYDYTFVFDQNKESELKSYTKYLLP